MDHIIMTSQVSVTLL